MRALTENRMDGFGPVTRSAPTSVAARAESAREREAARATEKPWMFEIGMPVRKLFFKAGSTTESEWCDGLVTGVNNVKSAKRDPVYTVLFEKDGYQERMDHAQIDALLHAQPPTSYRHEHIVRLKIDENLRPTPTDEAWYWDKKLPFDVEEEYGNGNIIRYP